MMLGLLTKGTVIPYAEPTKEKNDTDFSSTLSSTLPMAAVCALVPHPSNGWQCTTDVSRCLPGTSTTVQQVMNYTFGC